MSNDIFPTLPGLGWPVIKTPINSTTVKTSVSGRDYRRANWTYPKYQYQLVWDLLRQNASFSEMSTLMQFINAHYGQWDSWLFNDQDDNTITAQAIGIGDGNQTQFQLVRSLGSFVEPVFVANGTPSLYVNGVLQSTPGNYSINSTGLVTFTAPIPSTYVVTWTGNFYWRCRFTQDDSQDFYKTMSGTAGFWEVSQSPLTFVTVKP